MEWYVSNEGSEPLGPLATDLVARGILAGKVPVTSLVCAVGDSRWMPLAAVPEFGEALREVAPPPDATPPPPPLPPPDTVQGASWWVRYPNQQAMGPYPGAAVLERLQSGVLLPTVEVCRVGDSAWTPAAQELGFAAAVAARVPRPDRGPDVSSWASVKQPSVVAATADPPVGVPPTIDVVVLTLCFLGALLVGLATVSVVPFGPPMVAALVYADAWIAGVRRRPEDRSLANMSPLGWAMAVVLGCGIALPFYALVRRKYKTRPGNPVLKALVYAGATGTVAVILALVLWVAGVPVPWKQPTGEQSENPASIALQSIPAGTASMSASRLLMTCPPKSWSDLRAEAKASWTEEQKYRWTRRECGDLEVGYKFFPAGQHTEEHFVLILSYPHRGKRAAAVMKEAVDALFPHLGQPSMSVGACEPAQQAKAEVAQLGPSALNEFVSIISEQGGYRGAVFQEQGVRINVTPGSGARDTRRPNRVSITFSDNDRPELTIYPPIPWDATAPCKLQSSL